MLDKTHVALFEAIHVQRQQIRSQQDLADFFADHGVDVDRFNKVYTSFGVTSQINQAKARAVGYRTQGTPEMVVNGKYRITTRQAKGLEGMLKVASFLIDKERQALK